MIKIAPSILSADFAALADEVAKVEDTADLLHFDVMDGHFAPNISFGPIVVEALRQRTRLPLDVHLMVQHPERYISAFAHAGADYITVHNEVSIHLNRLIKQIREEGVRPGVALNPATPLSALEHVLPEVDLVLLMSVNPGFSGQLFIPFVLKKIEALARRVKGEGLACEIEVDGGIKVDNCQDVARAGATILVAGSAVFGSPDPKATIEKMRMRLQEVSHFSLKEG